MAKANEEKDIFDISEQDFIDQIDKSDNDNKEQKDSKQVRSQTVEFKGKAIPISDIPKILEDYESKINEQGRSFEDFKGKLADTITGKSREQDPDDNFDEVEFLSNKEYRKEYLNKRVEKLVSKKLEETQSSIVGASEQIGQMRFDRLKEDIQNELYDNGVDFDVNQNEKEIERYVMARFTPDFIRANPKEAVMLAIDALSKNKTTQRQGNPQFQSSQMERPSFPSAPVSNNTDGDMVRKRILQATPIDGSEGADGNPFV